MQFEGRITRVMLQHVHCDRTAPAEIGACCPLDSKRWRFYCSDTVTVLIGHSTESTASGKC